MDMHVVYSKTAKGLRTANAWFSSLSSQLKKVLALVDGKLTAQEIQAELGKLSEDELQQALDQLEEEGYIRVLTTRAQGDWPRTHAPAPMSVEVVSHVEVEEIDGDTLDFTNFTAEPAAGTGTKEEAARREAEAQVKLDAENKAREAAKAAAKAKLEAETKAAAEKKAREEAEAAAKAEAERQAREAAEKKTEAERREREAAELRAKADAAEKARLEAEEKARREAEARAKAEAEAMAAAAKADAERKAKEEAERKAREEADKKAREEAERETAALLARAEAAEKARLEAEENARREMERIAREAEEARLKADAEAKARAEAEARLEAERKAREEAEARARAKAEEEARREAERKAKEEAETAARAEAERKAREEAEARARAEAEEKSRLEAERLAREEAERKAREAEEARLKAESEARAKAEEDARREAERKEREEAEARAIAEEVARKEAERSAREEEKLQREAEKQAQREAEKTAKEEAKRIAREEAEERARIKAEEKAQAKATRTPTEPGKAKSLAVKAGLIYLPLTLVTLIALLHVVNLGMLVKPIEQIATESLGEPVTVKSVRGALFPKPSLVISGITVGANADLSIDAVHVAPVASTLFESVKTVKSLEIVGLKLQQDSFERPLKWLANSARAEHLKIGQISAKKITLKLNDLELGPFDAKPALNASGEPGGTDLESTDQTLKITITPQGGNHAIVLTGRNWPLPANPNLVFVELDAKGIASRNRIDFSQIDGNLLGGILKARALIDWSGQWSASGNFELTKATLPLMLAAFESTASIDGSATLNGNFAARSTQIGQLANTPEITASFEARDGKINGIDLVGAVLAGGNKPLSGTATPFDRISGTLQLKDGRYQFKQLALESTQFRAKGNVDIAPGQDISGKISAELTASSRKLQAGFGLGGKVGDVQRR